MSIYLKTLFNNDWTLDTGLVDKNSNLICISFIKVLSSNIIHFQKINKFNILCIKNLFPKTTDNNHPHVCSYHLSVVARQLWEILYVHNKGSLNTP